MFSFPPSTNLPISYYILSNISRVYIYIPIYIHLYIFIHTHTYIHRGNKY